MIITCIPVIPEDKPDQPWQYVGWPDNMPLPRVGDLIYDENGTLWCVKIRCFRPAGVELMVGGSIGNAIKYLNENKTCR